MVFWMTIIVINYLIASVGLIANFFYLKLVVFNKSFDGYCRIASSIICSATICLIISNVFNLSICLSYGSFFFSGPCVANDYYMVIELFHSYGECSIVSGIFILVFERYASVFFPSLRLSHLYKIWFSVLLLLHFLYVIFYLCMMHVFYSEFSLVVSLVSLSVLYITSFLLVIYLNLAAKDRYYETIGLLSLTKRYMLSESYELCRSCLPATFCSLTINIIMSITFWCLLFNWIPTEVTGEYLVLAFMTLNLTATLFPILFLIGSKKIRKKIGKVNPLSAQSETEKENPFKVRKLDGNLINIAQTQNDYFKQLQTTWS